MIYVINGPKALEEPDAGCDQTPGALFPNTPLLVHRCPDFITFEHIPT
jgi:hypothetical protein